MLPVRSVSKQGHLQLRSVQRPGHWADNCRMVYWRSEEHSRSWALSSAVLKRLLRKAAVWATHRRKVERNPLPALILYPKKPSQKTWLKKNYPPTNSPLKQIKVPPLSDLPSEMFSLLSPFFSGQRTDCGLGKGSIDRVQESAESQSNVHRELPCNS